MTGEGGTTGAGDAPAERTVLIAVPPNAGQRRILLVEDHPDTRDLLVTALKSQGYAVDAAVDAEEGLHFLRQQRYDLVIAHYNMPGKTAAAMLQEAAADGLLGDAATLVVTAHPDPVGVSPAEVVRKPLDITKFLVQVQKIFASRPPGARTAEVAAPAVAAVEALPAADLVLYVSPGSPASLRAVRNFEKIAAGFDPVSFRYRVCDISEEPQPAEDDQVLFTPTLVKRTPAPPVWVLGDLSDQEVVASLLDVCGARRKAGA